MTAIARGRLPLAAWLVLVAATFVAAAWSIIVPVFEAPDEPHHWQYARHLHEHRRLPVYDAGAVEANQPPTYYLLIAPLARASDTPSQAVWADADGRLVVPYSPRFFLNERDALHRYAPIRLARLLTVVLSTAGLVFVYLGAIEATGSRAAAIFALGVAGFLPQFSFRAASISNDTVLVTFSAAATWLTLRLLRRGFSWPVGVGAAVAVTLAYLTKISAICLAPPLALAVLCGREPLRQRVWRAAGLLSICAVLVTPWSIWNVVMYGDVFASGAMRRAVAQIIEPKPITSPFFWTTFPHLLSHSFVGVFGWLNVWLPPWTYTAVFLSAGAALLALLVALARRRASGRATAVLLATVAGNLAVVVHINLSFTQPQGRYLFPALGALATLLSMGLLAIRRGVPRTALAGAGVVAMFALNLYALGWVVAPSYHPAPVAAPSSVDLVLTTRTHHDMAPDEGGMLRVSGADSQSILPTSVDAAAVSFLQFELQGTGGDPELTGSVYFVRSDSPASEQKRVDFTWKADGRQRLVTVALAGHPEWRGLVTAIRIDPINGRTEANLGARVRLGQVRLKGRL